MTASRRRTDRVILWANVHCRNCDFTVPHEDKVGDDVALDHARLMAKIHRNNEPTHRVIVNFETREAYYLG